MFFCEWRETQLQLLGFFTTVTIIYLRRCGFGPFSSFFIELHSVDAATSIVFNIFERSSRTFEFQGTSAWIWNNLEHKKSDIFISE